MHFRRQWVAFGLVTALFLSSAAGIVCLGPERIVEMLRLGNLYEVVFALAVLGGSSSLSIAPFYSFVIICAAGGASVPLLAVLGGVGLAISDSFFFYLGFRGKRMLSIRVQRRVASFSSWVAEQPRWKASLTIYAYIALTPLPNDVLMFALAIINYPFRRFLPLVVLGDVMFVFLLALIGSLLARAV